MATESKAKRDAYDALLRESHLMKPIFKYEASLGQFPKEVANYVFVKKKDLRTKSIRIIPDMAYSIEANRPAVPKHQMLEDDWRACRSVFHNFVALARYQQNPIQRAEEFAKANEIASRVLEKSFIKPKPHSGVPMLTFYKNNVECPSGYLYRRYKQTCTEEKEKHKTGQSKEREKVHTHVVRFEGPGVDTAYVPHGKYVKKMWDAEMKYYDADVIVGGPASREVIIYNEPDAIPVLYMNQDFSIPLLKRVETMATGGGRDKDLNKTPQIPLVVPAAPGPGRG